MSGHEIDREYGIPVIELWHPGNSEVTCCMCGQEDLNRWGIPVDSETALIVGNDFEGDWGSKPVCEACYNRHQAGEFVGEDTRY